MNIFFGLPMTITGMAMMTGAALAQGGDANRAPTEIPEWITAAIAGCEAGDAEACSTLAFSYERSGTERDNALANTAYGRAAQLRQSACDGGDAAACAELGFSYAYGIGVEENMAEAIALWARSCDLGDAESCNAAAWELAIAPDTDEAGLAEALRLAERADSLTPDVANTLDTLAAAYARLGRFDDAVAAQEKAIALLGDFEDEYFVERLALYQAGEMYIERGEDAE